MKFNLTILLLVLSLASQGQKYSVSATRYKIVITNDGQYTLKLKSGNLTKTTVLLKPGEAISVDGNFPKYKLRKTSFHIYADEETRDLDQDYVDQAYRNNKRILQRSKESTIEGIEGEFRRRLGSLAASKMNLKSDYWLLDIIGSGINNLGKAGVAFYNTVDFISEYEKFYDKPISYLDKYLKDKLDIDAYLIDKGTKYALSKFGVDEASSEFIIQAVAVRAEKLQATEEYFGERRSGLDQEYNANTRRISSFRYSENGNIYDKISPLSDLKTITPFVIMDINPLMKSYGLGSSWKSVNDAFYNDSDNDGEEEFHDGLWNRIYSASIIFGIGRDFMLSENTRSRFYLGMDYSNALYNGPDSDISLVRSFFDVIPEGADGFVVSSPLQLQQTLLSPSLVFKSFLKNNIGIDLGIRYNQSTGDLLLFKSELQNGFKWSQDRVEYLSKEYTPSAFVKIGLSYYGNHRSLSITTWAEYMSIRHDTNPSFPIVNTNSQSPLVVGNNSYLRWGFGMNFGF